MPLIFFKQKTAYEIGVRLVGSEMCIRDRGAPPRRSRITWPQRGITYRIMHAIGCARRFLAAPSLRQASAPVSRAALHARAQLVARGCTRSPARALAVPALPLWNSASPFALVAGPAVRAAPARRPYATLSFFGGAPLAVSARALHALARPAATPRLAPPRPTLVPARGESTMKRRKKMMNKHKVRKRRRAQRLKSSARRD